MAKKKTLRAAVIGVGGMGDGHINAYRHHPRVEVTALADNNPEILRRSGQAYGIDVLYESGEEMLRKENPDVVSIVTPNKFHMPLTLAAFKAGAHVLCEKPMAMNAREARRMLNAADKAGRRLMINFSYRFTEQSWALKKQVETGILGDIYFARTIWHRRRGMPKFGGWFGQKELAGGGPLIDLGVHRLDLALWLMDYPQPVWVMGSAYDPIASDQARREKKKFDVEDLAVGLIKFDNGATVEIETSWAANIAERELMETRLLGTKGGLVQRNRNETYEFEAEIYLEREGAQFDMKLHPPVPGVQPSPAHFADAILDDKPHIATGEEGLVVMEILDSIYESARKGAPVRITKKNGKKASR